jgi:hypothetical protein
MVEILIQYLQGPGDEAPKFVQKIQLRGSIGVLFYPEG